MPVKHTAAVNKVLQGGAIKKIKDTELVRNFLVEKAHRQSGHIIVRNNGDKMSMTKRAPTGMVAKSAPIDADSAKTAAAKFGIDWKEGMESRVIPYFSSNEMVDRAGDIVLQLWEMDDYNRSPLMCFGHDWEGLPIGKSISHEVVDVNTDEYEGPSLKQQLLFATAETYGFADQVFRMVKGGFLTQCSVGMFPGEIIIVERKADRELLGLGPEGVLFSKNLLIETSPVTVPALPSAGIAKSIKKCIKSQEFEPGDLEAFRVVVARYAEGDKNEADQTVQAVWKDHFGTGSKRTTVVNENADFSGGQESVKRWMFMNSLGNKFYDIGDVVKLEHEGEDRIGRIEGTGTNGDDQVSNVRLYERDEDGFFIASGEVILVSSNKLTEAHVPHMRAEGEIKDLQLSHAAMRRELHKNMQMLRKDMSHLVRSVVAGINEAIDGTVDEEELLDEDLAELLDENDEGVLDPEDLSLLEEDDLDVDDEAPFGDIDPDIDSDDLYDLD